MDDPGSATLSWLLRAWRCEVARLPAAQVAGVLEISRSAVANWESGARTPNTDLLAELDALYGADGALQSLAAAVSTPHTVSPRSEWWHNYRQSGPVWAWARTPAGTGRFRLQFRWGPLSTRLTRPASSHGLIVTLPVSVANPGVQARLDPPGWIDFGPGRIPRRLGIPTVSGLSHLRVADPADHAVAITAGLLRPALDRDGQWIEKVKALIGQQPELVEEAFSRPRGPSRLTDLSGSTPDTDAGPAATWSGQRYRQARQGRGLSRAEAAAQATALSPAAPVTDDQLLLLEAGGHPRVPLLAARLDTIYRLDGYSVKEPLTLVSAGTDSFTFAPPPWWIGPLWITPQGPAGAGPAEVILQWPPWERRLLLRPGATITTRAAGQAEPLSIRLPPQWTVIAGLGFDPQAIDVNVGWHAIDGHHAHDIFNRYHGLYLELFHKTRQHLRQLLQQENPDRTPRG